MFFESCRSMTIWPEGYSVYYSTKPYELGRPSTSKSPITTAFSVPRRQDENVLSTRRRRNIGTDSHIQVQLSKRCLDRHSCIQLQQGNLKV